ncbi:MAG TPA: O-antigen ligase family protein, partial [Chroococcales cyanobacterium]|jgi:putative inorganic carbon (HCO3(-)) transporter
LTTLVAVGASPYLAASIKGFAKLAIYWLAFATFLWNLRGKKAVFLIGALFAAVLLESLLGVYQYHIRVAPLALWEDADATVQLTRVFGTLRNPNLLAGYLLPVIPLGLAGFFHFPNKVFKGFALSTGLLAILCLGFTFSRGGYVGLLVEVLLLGLLGGIALWQRLDPSKKKWLLIGGGLGMAFLFLLIFQLPGIHERLLSIVATREHSSNSFRLNVWSAVFHMIRDNWLFGIGIGNGAFTKAYPLYMISGFEALAAYNIFLEAMVEAGIFGLLAFLWLLLAGFARSLLFAFKGQERFWAAGLGASLLGLMAHGMVDTVFFRPSVQLLFWLLLALIIRLGERSPA